MNITQEDHDNGGNEINEYIFKVNGEEEHYQRSVANKSCNVTILPRITVLNSHVGCLPPLPIKLDGNLPCRG